MSKPLVTIKDAIPLVTIVTPYTQSRKHFMPLVKQMVENQTYPNIEWITDDNETNTLGRKINDMCAKAKGTYIVNFDSDDWYSEDYVRYSLQFMLSHKLDITGLNTAYFINKENKKAYLFKSPNNMYCFGSGMMYTKDYWAMNNCKDITGGVDAHFVALCTKIKPHNNLNLFYATLHNNNSTNTVLNMNYYTELDYNQTIQKYDIDISNN